MRGTTGPTPRQILGLALPAAVMSTLSVACVPIAATPSEQSMPPSVFDDTTPRFSPDGKDIVFVRETDDDSDLYVLNVRTGDRRLLADVSDYDLDPVFSRDGIHVLFETSPNGFAQLHLVPSAGGKSQPISDVRDGWATFPSWSPDGDVIVYSCGRPSYEESVCVCSRRQANSWGSWGMRPPAGRSKRRGHRTAGWWRSPPIDRVTRTYTSST